MDQEPWAQGARAPPRSRSFLSRTCQNLMQRVPLHHCEVTTQQEVCPASATGSLKEKPVSFQPWPMWVGRTHLRTETIASQGHPHPQARLPRASAGRE